MIVNFFEVCHGPELAEQPCFCVGISFDKIDHLSLILVIILHWLKWRQWWLSRFSCLWIVACPVRLPISTTLDLYLNQIPHFCQWDVKQVSEQSTMWIIFLKPCQNCLQPKSGVILWVQGHVIPQKNWQTSLDMWLKGFSHTVTYSKDISCPS